MLNLDIDKIINGTAEKRIINMYESLKQNYTKDEAEKYRSAYVNESFGFIMNNSEKIFTESYYGYDFYTEAITKVGNLCPSILRAEKEKVDAYTESHKDQLNPDQLVKLESLSETIGNMIAENTNFEVVASFINNENTNIQDSICEAVYTNNTEALNTIFSEATTATTIAYGPKVYALNSDIEIGPKFESILSNNYIDTDKSYEKWKEYVENVAIANKLHCDENYNEAVRSLPYTSRKICNFLESTSLNNLYSKFAEVSVNSTDITYESVEFAMNNIYSDLIITEAYSDEDAEEKSINESFQFCIENAELGLLIKEFQITENEDSIINGYSFFENEITVNDAIKNLSESLSKYEIYDESVDDITDEDIDNVFSSEDTGKKPQAPKLSHKLKKTYNSMDKEAEYFKKSAANKRKGLETKNMFKAMTAVPKHIIDDIKQQINMIDDADLNRRKAYMTQPGFRKKAFKNLKLALMYSTAAGIKLSLVPTLAVCRHFSKTRDIRVRNELISELETNIKITDEKINDATNEGDKAAKYQLIRIRSKLERELTRVKLNSKYI